MSEQQVVTGSSGSMREVRAAPVDGIEVRKVTGAVGAKLTGVDLNQEYDDATFAVVRKAFLDHCILVLPGQFLTPESHLRYARRYGEPFMPHYYAKNTVEGYPDIAIVPNFGKAKAPAEGWHTDWSHMTEPPQISIARPTVLPPYGCGDTMFSNQYRAYESLSDGMKEFLEGRRVKFVGSRPARGTPVKVMNSTSDQLAQNAREEVSNYHPIARKHEDTGRIALYLNRPGEAMVQFEGMTPEESLPILEYLYAHSTNPDNVYRHQWSMGDVVMWDNRCAMHYGVHDYGDDERTLNRITVGGAV